LQRRIIIVGSIVGIGVVEGGLTSITGAGSVCLIELNRVWCCDLALTISKAVSKRV
jgi:hypothetical protein